MITLNQLNQKRQITNYSSFVSGSVAGIDYNKPVAYIKAYLNNELQVTNNNIDYAAAKAHFLSVGITQATVNTQCNLFKSNLNKNGIVTEKVIKLKYQLKNVTDLNQYTLIAILDNDNKPVKVLDKSLFENDNINKVAVPLKNGIAVVTDL